MGVCTLFLEKFIWGRGLSNQIDAESQKRMKIKERKIEN